jgi:hypothetical protein
MPLQCAAELGEMLIVVRGDQRDPIRECHTPEGDMNTAAVPLFRRQPSKKSEGLLASATEDLKRLPSVVAQVLAFVCPSIGVEWQGVAFDDSLRRSIGRHLSQD